MRDFPEKNLNYPVLIKNKSNSGSGFYLIYKEKEYLITAKHVLFDKNNNLLSDSIQLISYFGEDKCSLRTNLEINKNTFFSKDYDIAFVLIASLEKISEGKFNSIFEKTIKNEGVNTSNIVALPEEAIKKYENSLVGNEVFVMGFPVSIGNPKDNQINYEKPLLKKGIVAGKNDIKRTIIIDSAIHFGNSGGLVIEVEKVMGGTNHSGIGIISEYVPFIDILESKKYGYNNVSIENSGYSVVVPIDTIEKLIKDATEPFQIKSK